MAEELIIPVRLDAKNAAQDLKQLGQSGLRAGDDVAQGMGRAQQGAKGFGSELASLMRAQIGLAAMRQGLGAIGDQLKENAQYVADQAKNFQQLRAAMQQVAALRGAKNQTGLTLEQVSQAQQAGLMPEAWRKAQEEFQSRAGAYLEGNQARLTRAQGREYQARIAAFAQARGITPSEAMALGGGLLQFSEGPQDVQGLMARYGKLFKTLERAPTPVNQLLPQMSRIMSQGFSPEEAAQALAITSEAMPGEEEVGVEAAMRAITNARMAGKGGQLGLREGMGSMEQLEAAARTLQQRRAAGEDVDKLMAEFAPDIRERRGLLAFMNRGVQAGGFERVRGYAAETAPDFTQRAIEEYRNSDTGRQNAVEVALAAEQARLGARDENVVRAFQIAEVELNGGDRDEQVPRAGRIAGMLPGVNDPRAQQLGRQAIARARAQLGEQITVGDEAASLNRGLADETLRALLKRIEENTRKEGRPLAAPPPRPGGRMGG
jgi:hypothetical protein